MYNATAQKVTSAKRQSNMTQRIAVTSVISTSVGMMLKIASRSTDWSLVSALQRPRQPARLPVEMKTER